MPAKLESNNAPIFLMGFTKRIQYFLVHALQLSNKEARQLIGKKLVKINGRIITDNVYINDFSEIELNGKILRELIKPVYLKFHKPRGFESTLNENVKNNLSSFFPQDRNLSIAGRLDKASEGLLLLSNDGKWVEHICNPLQLKEKEYLVNLDKLPDEDFLNHFRKGLPGTDQKSTPCFCEIIDKCQIRVILTEGKNRQIRRMCFRLGYKVLSLKRIRIHTTELGDLAEGCFKEL